MKKLITLTILSIFLLSFFSCTVSALYTKDHIYITLKAFQEVDSPITQKCRDKLDKVLDGNHLADLGVLHYTENREGDNFMSYAHLHTRAGYNQWMELAGTDEDLECAAYGDALHIIQDQIGSHGEQGVTPKYIKAYYSSNYLGHMQVENDFEKKDMAMLKASNDPLIVQGTLQYYDSILLNNVFADPKYLDLMKQLTNLDMRNDANIFANGYKGKGFYDTVYGKPLSLPNWFWGISLSTLIGGLLMFLILLGLRIKGIANNWVFLLMIPFLLFAIFGATVLITLKTAQTWQTINTVIQIIPIRVSEADVEFYRNAALQASEEFLKTGVLNVDDATGLSYRDRTGIWHEGALDKAEKSFQVVLMPIIIVAFIMYCLIFGFLTFRRKKNK